VPSARAVESIAVQCASHRLLHAKLKLGAGSQERDGKTPCRAMHWVSGASVAVKIGFAVGRAKVLWPSAPYVVPSSANSAWFSEIAGSCPLRSGSNVKVAATGAILGVPLGHKGDSWSFPTCRYDHSLSGRRASTRRILVLMAIC